MAKEVLIVNCDSTYPLNSVVSLFESVAGDPDIGIQQKTLQISQLQAVSEEVRRRRLLCGVFVVNAYESRLSINEEKAGIGYAVLYRALLEAAQGRVLVVIGGDDRYKDGEQDRSVLSTWAYHKIAAQFDDTYLDGRRGFVFSWDERHNPVHREALGSYLRAITSGQPGLQQPFTPTPPSKPMPKPEPSRPPSTSTDQMKSKTPRTDPKSQPAKTHDSGAALYPPAPKTVSGDGRSETATKHGRARSQLSVSHDVKYTDKEAKCINETLEKHKDESQKVNPRRVIRIVGHLVYGKVVPGFGTLKGHLKGNLLLLEDIPDIVIQDIKRDSKQMESASLIVFDDETTRNCYTVRELSVPKMKEDNFRCHIM